MQSKTFADIEQADKEVVYGHAFVDELTGVNHFEVDPSGKSSLCNKEIFGRILSSGNKLKTCFFKPLKRKDEK